MENCQAAGSSEKRITSHAIGTVFTEVAEDGGLKIAAMNYTKYGRTTVRFPMGKSLRSGSESLSKTQIREILQEAAEDPGNFSYKLLFGGRIVYYDVVPDDHNPYAELHLKAFFVAKVTGGSLREHRSVEHEGEVESVGPHKGESKEETLDRLVWYDTDALFLRMEQRGNSLRCHLNALVAALAKFCQEFPAMAHRYGRLAENARPYSTSAEPYRQLVFQYVREVQGG